MEKVTNLPVKNHVPNFEELVMKLNCAIQTDYNFSNPKVIPTDYVTENCTISSDLIGVVVMDEDAIILKRDLMGKQNEQISPPGFD